MSQSKVHLSQMWLSKQNLNSFSFYVNEKLVGSLLIYFNEMIPKLLTRNKKLMKE